MTPQLLESWLVLQCQAIPGVRVGYARFRLSESEESSASWPSRSSPDTELREMLGMARRSRGPVVAQPTGMVEQGARVLRVARPILVQDQIAGAIVIEINQSGAEQQDAVMRLLQWGNTWLELLSQCNGGTDGTDELTQALGLALRPQSFQQTAMAIVGHLAHQLDFERVSLGIKKRDGLRIVALSDSAEVSPSSELALRISQSMARHIEQDQGAKDEVPEPTQDEGTLNLALTAEGEVYGAMAFEARAGEGIPDAKARRATEIVNLFGPILALKQDQETSVPRRLARQLSGRIRTYSELRPAARLLVIAGSIVLLAAWLLSSATYRVSGAAELQGEVQRALTAPFDGYVAKANARAGERVNKGFVLAELDDRELRLEHRQLEGDKTELDKQYRKALAALDHAQARILKAQIEQAEARIELLSQQLDRTRLTVPFDGVVVEGDLSRSLGKPVERGEVLFEIAPLDAYRVAVQVADRDISLIESGLPGQLVLAALPNEKLSIEVINITRMVGSTTEPGTFRVEARLVEASDLLRPGMRGVAKLEAGERSRGWIWTHELVDWLRYRLWAWLP